MWKCRVVHGRKLSDECNIDLPLSESQKRVITVYNTRRIKAKTQMMIATVSNQAIIIHFEFQLISIIAIDAPQISVLSTIDYGFSNKKCTLFRYAVVVVVINGSNSSKFHSTKSYQNYKFVLLVFFSLLNFSTMMRFLSISIPQFQGVIEEFACMHHWNSIKSHKLCVLIGIRMLKFNTTRVCFFYSPICVIQCSTLESFSPNYLALSLSMCTWSDRIANKTHDMHHKIMSIFLHLIRTIKSARSTLFVAFARFFSMILPTGKVFNDGCDRL